jgi:hypothetical protein
MADIEFFPDEEGEEEEGTEEQRTNRTFIILVGALGGLLALAICVFVAWMLIIGPRAADSIEEQNQAIEATNAARSAAVAATETAAALPTATAVPTDTPLPTNTPRPTATKPPTVAPTAVVTGTVGEVAQELTISPQPTASSMGRAVPETGIGVLGAGVAGAGLVFLIAVVRRMRRAS